MPKRAALLFDQLMVALQKVVDNQEKETVGGRGRGISRSHLLAANPEIVAATENDQTVPNSVIFKHNSILQVIQYNRYF